MAGNMGVRYQPPNEQIADARYIWRLHMTAYPQGSCGAVKRNMRQRFAHWVADIHFTSYYSHGPPVFTSKMSSRAPERTQSIFHNQH